MKTVHCFLGSDLRAGHLGLAKFAKKNNVDLTKLATGEAVIFINRAKDKMKCYSFNGVLSYLRIDEPNRVIDLNAIEQFPKAFTKTGHVDYGRALKLSLERALSKNKRFEETMKLSAEGT